MDDFHQLVGIGPVLALDPLGDIVAELFYSSAGRQSEFPVVGIDAALRVFGHKALGDVSGGEPIAGIGIALDKHDGGAETHQVVVHLMHLLLEI